MVPHWGKKKICRSGKGRPPQCHSERSHISGRKSSPLSSEKRGGRGSAMHCKGGTSKTKEGGVALFKAGPIRRKKREGETKRGGRAFPRRRGLVFGFWGVAETYLQHFPKNGESWLRKRILRSRRRGKKKMRSDPRSLENHFFSIVKKESQTASEKGRIAPISSYKKESPHLASCDGMQGTKKTFLRFNTVVG